MLYINDVIILMIETGVGMNWNLVGTRYPNFFSGWYPVPTIFLSGRYPVPIGTQKFFLAGIRYPAVLNF